MTLKHFTPASTPVEACGSWNEGHYLLDKKSAYALEMALLTKRPLLVRGEPGLGKSYLARAAATQLKRAFVAEVINSNTEGQDLLWRDDPISRLNDAQSKQKEGDDLHIRHYINPSVLWWAFDWKEAAKQYKDCHHKNYKPQTIDKELRQNGIVLLIDEIDKADPSLPNSLLEVLGNGGFDVPIINKTIGKNNCIDQNENPNHTQNYIEPLVIITTNDERELPPAFVRRCLVLHLTLDKDNIEQWLIERASVHRGLEDKNCSIKVKQQAAQQLIKERKEADNQGMIKPGLAEYIDLLTALCEMTKNVSKDQREQQQIELLDDIKDFALKKA